MPPDIVCSLFPVHTAPAFCSLRALFSGDGCWRAFSLFRPAAPQAFPCPYWLSCHPLRRSPVHIPQIRLRRYFRPYEGFQSYAGGPFGHGVVTAPGKSLRRKTIKEIRHAFCL